MTPRFRPLATGLAVLLTLTAVPARAADVPPLLARPSVGQQLATVAKSVAAKAEQGAHTEAELADELKQLETLFAEHKGDANDVVADMLTMKAQIYMDVLEEPEKAAALFRQFKADFPASPLAKEVDGAIKQIEQQAETTKVARALKPGVLFPAFPAGLKDLDGQPLSLDRFKGKVVLVDFWATWCEPCVEEMPNVIATYKKHHAEGFEIVGVSLDREGDRDKLTAFLKKNEMTWPQFYDGKYWEGQLVVQYGIQAIPNSYLLDSEGKIIGKALRGPALEKAVAAALKK
jgi:thiol-disulfide isomerase/thioredoxin